MAVLRVLTRASPITSETPDDALVHRAQTGDTAAFRALFERHVLSVRRFLRDLLRDEDAAGDATQETFTRAHVRLPRLAEQERFKPWLLGIARNVAFEARRLKVHEALDDDEAPAAVIPSPNPEDVLLDRELERHFHAALAVLSPPRRAALLMRVDHGLTYEEIAEAMGWSLPTVKNEIHRARLTLRAQLLPHVGGRP